jgi:hypothetical protein
VGYFGCVRGNGDMRAASDEKDVTVGSFNPSLLRYLLRTHLCHPQRRPGSGSGMNNPDHISESLETIFWVIILKFSYADPGWKTFGSGLNPGSATLRAADEDVSDPWFLSIRVQRKGYASKYHPDYLPRTHPCPPRRRPP